MSERLFQRAPGGNWYCWIYVNGEQVKHSTKTKNKRQAAEVRRRLEREAHHANSTKNQAAVGNSLRDVLERYIERQKVRRRRSEGTISYYHCKAGHLIRLLGETTNVNTFSDDVEDSYVDTRIAEGAGDNTIHKELMVFRAALKLAKKDRICQLDLDIIRTDHEPNYVPRRRFLTEGEYKKLMKELSPKRKATIAFMVLAAPRDSEWQNVQRQDVDFTSLLTLRGTKTEGAYRHLPLKAHKKLAKLLKGVVAALPEDEDFLFPEWSNIRRDLHVACGKADIDPISPNDLRRTFGTWCYRGGMLPARIALLLGHRDARMVERVYGVMDAASLGADVAGVFNKMDLPDIETPSISATKKPRRKRDKSGIERMQSGADMARMAQRPETKKPSPTGREANQRGSLAVPGDRIELPTRGFSVLCSTD